MEAQVDGKQNMEIVQSNRPGMEHRRVLIRKMDGIRCLIRYLT